jgi:hypothetical protein
MLDVMQFAFEVQSVIALRLWRMSGGGTEAAVEAHRMVAEKADALWRSHLAAGAALAGGRDGEAVAAAAFRPYRRAVKANHRRLSSS